MYFIIIAVFIGAVIGALTNALAIKMLFRPYQAWKLGNWEIPFTPGIIPKRRTEIAEQLGALVENYLFTAQGIKQFLEKSGLKVQLLEKLKSKLVSYQERKGVTIEEVVDQLLHEGWKGKLKEKGVYKLEELLTKGDFRDKRLRELLTEESEEVFRSKMKLLAPVFISGVKQYLYSAEGKKWIQSMLMQLLEGKKMLGFLAGYLVEDNKLQDKITEYMGKILENPNTKANVEGLIIEKWNEILDLTVKEIIEELDGMLIHEANSKLEDILNYIGRYPMSRIVEVALESNFLDKSYQLVMDKLLSKMERVFPYLSIAQVVKEEVNRFSLAELERIILEIVNKELRMITYLGGVLGGFIGLLQGLLYLFI